MGTMAPIDRDQWVTDLCAHVSERAEATGWMVAVRHHGDAVTFSDLNAAIADYRLIAGTHGMSVESAFTAAMFHTMPGLTGLEANEQARAMNQLISWVGRDVPAPVAARRGLRSVG
ncbi:hypothetical protein [Gordonia zhaorongruii]|uniref:hypothetical protein n=1 Tax=Gordonia zhaorongruii TaxID=2597659 RepID=UPI001049264C|nr:hypothetical protein [Gordonia zhaorongruii]